MGAAAPDIESLELREMCNGCPPEQGFALFLQDENVFHKPQETFSCVSLARTQSHAHFRPVTEREQWDGWHCPDKSRLSLRRGMLLPLPKSEFSWLGGRKVATEETMPAGGTRFWNLEMIKLIYPLCLFQSFQQV